MKFDGTHKVFPLQTKVIDSHVELEEVKRNLQFDDPEAAHPDDDNIQQLIESACMRVENYCNQFFAKKLCTYKAFNWSGTTLKIKVANYLAIKSLVIDSETLTEGTHFDVFKQKEYFEIWFTNSQTAEALTLEFEAGYNSGDLPSPIHDLIIKVASDGYDTDRSQYIYNVTKSDFFQNVAGPYVNTRY